MIISVLIFGACNVAQGQSMIGMTKLEVQERVKREHKEFRKDHSVVKQQFNYLKYVNGMRTRTWILHFTDEDICKTSKLVCGYSEFDDVVEKLSTEFQKVGDSQWEYIEEADTFQVNLIKQEWYFTLRETRKE